MMINSRVFVFGVLIGLSVCASLAKAAAKFSADPSTAATVSSSPQYLTYQQASEVALSGNPDLAAIRHQEEGFKLRSNQALAPNNPVLTYNKMNVPGASPSLRSASDNYAITYQLNFPGKSLEQSANNRYQAEATRETGLAKEIELLGNLSNLYVSVAVNQIIYQLLEDEEKRDQNLYKLLEKKFATSQAAKVDLLNAKVVLASTQQDILVNRNELESLYTQFRQIIRRPADTNLFPQIPTQIVVPTLKRDFAELTRIMFENRHLLLAAQKQVEAARANMKLASLQALPDLQFNAGMTVYNETSAEPNPGVGRDYQFGVGIAIPLFFPFNELTLARAAHSDLSVAEMQAESQRLAAIADLQTTFTSLTAVQKEIKSLSTLVVPAAKASYDLTLLTYSLGKADYFRLNESRRTWLDAQKNLLGKQVAATQLFNLLIQQIGCDFEDPRGAHACHARN